MPVQIATFMFSAYTAVALSGDYWLLWAIPFLVVISIGIWIMDKQSLFTAEMVYTQSKNPPFLELCQNAKEANERLKRLEDKLEGLV